MVSCEKRKNPSQSGQFWVEDVDELFRIKVPGFISRNPKDQIVSYYPNKATAFWVVYKFKLQSDAQGEAITESDLSKFLSKINNV